MVNCSANSFSLQPPLIKSNLNILTFECVIGENTNKLGDSNSLNTQCLNNKKISLPEWNREKNNSTLISKESLFVDLYKKEEKRYFSNENDKKIIFKKAFEKFSRFIINFDFMDLHFEVTRDHDMKFIVYLENELEIHVKKPIFNLYEDIKKNQGLFSIFKYNEFVLADFYSFDDFFLRYLNYIKN